MSILIDALKAIFVISEICVEESKTHISSEKAMEKIREQLRKTQAYTELKKDVDKLAHYEDLEEQGRLIELPCKVGDRVYEIYRFCIYGAWEIDEHRVTLEDLPHIGKTVFLTKEEAEAKLAELKGE